MPMHEHETRVDADLVRRLLAAQAPAVAREPVVPLPGLGTVHHVFRVGDGLVARLPRRAAWADDLARGATVLARAAPALPVAVPELVLVGRPDEGFPLPWALHRWVRGAPVTPSAAGAQLGRDLATTVAALHAVDPEGLPPAGRAPLAELDGGTRQAIDASWELDRTAAHAAWDLALTAPAWDGRRVAIHGDLLPPNLLIDRGRLVGVLDWDGAGAGDGAHDLVAAWATLRGEGREAFRLRAAPDDGDWTRARGIALHQAVLAIPYYRRTNRAFAALCCATAREVLADTRAG